MPGGPAPRSPSLKAPPPASPAPRKPAPWPSARLPLRLFLCSVILYQMPVLYFLLEVRTRAPEPRSKVRRTCPSTNSMDRKSLCKDRKSSGSGPRTDGRVSALPCCWTPGTAGVPPGTAS